MNKLFSSIFTFLFAVVLFLGCTYWIYKNVKLKDLIGTTNVPSKVREAETKKVEIRNNDVVEVLSPDLVKPIIYAKNIEGAESLSNLAISPDGKKICFLVHTITPIWLYVANVNGSNLKRVNLAKNCVWSPDSKFVAYNNHTTDVSPVDVFTYNPITVIIKNFTTGRAKAGFMRSYDTPEWLDASSIKSYFVEMSFSDVLTNQKHGVSTIKIETGEVVDEFLKLP